MRSTEHTAAPSRSNRWVAALVMTISAASWGCAAGKVGTPKNTVWVGECQCKYCEQPPGPGGCQLTGTHIPEPFTVCSFDQNKLLSKQQNIDDLKAAFQAECDHEAANFYAAHKLPMVCEVVDPLNGWIYAPEPWFRTGETNSCDKVPNIPRALASSAVDSADVTVSSAYGSFVRINVNGEEETIPVDGTLNFQGGRCYPGSGETQCPTKVTRFELRSPQGFHWNMNGDDITDLYIDNRDGGFVGVMDSSGVAMTVAEPETTVFGKAHGVEHDYSTEGSSDSGQWWVVDWNENMLHGAFELQTEEGTMVINLHGTIADFPPYVNAGNDQEINCLSYDGAWVNLNGTIVDPDLEALEFAGWYKDFGDTFIASGVNAQVWLPVGTHYLTFVGDDGPKVIGDRTVVNIACE